jgi:hypothetical protein
VAQVRDEAEQKLFNVFKYVRAYIRVKYSIDADNVLNELLPRIESSFWSAFTDGREWNFDDVELRGLLDEVLAIES